MGGPVRFGPRFFSGSELSGEAGLIGGSGLKGGIG